LDREKVMQRLPRPGAGLVLVACVVAFSIGLVDAAPANSLPTVAAPGGGECAALKEVPDLPGLWLGHFTGGRFFDEGGARLVDWRDQYSCFPNRAACSHWQRDLHRLYWKVQGYTTCLPLR
jgi:hypothetical protein